MKMDELKKLSDSELSGKLVELKTELQDKRLAVQNNTEKNTSLLSKLRKDTARIYTIMNERKNNE